MSPWSATLPSASQLATIQWGSTSAGAKSGLVPTWLGLGLGLGLANSNPNPNPAHRAAEQPQHGELLGGEQLATHLLRAELAADALGGGVREAGRRGWRRALRLAARARWQVQQHLVMGLGLG